MATAPSSIEDDLADQLPKEDEGTEDGSGEMEKQREQAMQIVQQGDDETEKHRRRISALSGMAASSSKDELEIRDSFTEDKENEHFVKMYGTEERMATSLSQLRKYEQKMKELSIEDKEFEDIRKIEDSSSSASSDSEWSAAYGLSASSDSEWSAAYSSLHGSLASVGHDFSPWCSDDDKRSLCVDLYGPEDTSSNGSKELTEDCDQAETTDKGIHTDIDQLHFQLHFPQTEDDASQTPQDDQPYPHKGHPIHCQDESTQTVDFTCQGSQAQQQYHNNMGCPAKITKIIGPMGGIIELFGHRVFYPPYSLPEETQIELSIDNNPCNFPKEGLPITSILNIKPSMKLEVPAIVTMPTTCRAASGEATIQIWSKEEGQDWEKSQTVSLTNKNEISFETDHFSGSTGTSVDGDESNLEFTLKNRLFIQKDTGTILSVFWIDDKNMQDTVRECNEQEFKRVIPTDQLLTGTLDFEFEVAALCVSPSGIVYSSAKEQEDPAVFKITSEFIISRCPQSIRFLPSVDEFPDSTKRLRIKYSVSTQTPEIYLVKWPVEIKKPNAPGATNITVDHSRTLADTIAQTGSHVKKRGEIKTRLKMKEK